MTGYDGYRGGDSGGDGDEAGSELEPTAAPPLEVLTEHFDGEIPGRMSRFAIPGVSVAIVDEGEVVWSNAYGSAMTVDAVGRAESISKSVSAWGIMRLVEEGTISLDDPVGKHLAGWALPASEVNADAVTIRRLLSHTAGLPQGPIGPGVEYEPGTAMPTVREYLDRETHFAQAPGRGFQYSNVGFAVLELLVEEVTGQDFATYMEREVLSPLGMENSAFGWEQRFAGRVPKGYELDGTAVAPYTYAVHASGGLFATVTDVARFAAAGMSGEFYGNHEVLREESIEALYEKQVEIPGMFGVVADWYGFGHFLEELPEGGLAAWHGGQGHGWMTHFHAVPEAGDALVIFTNSERSWPFMAQILSDWAEWSGHGNVQYGRITTITTAFDALVGLLTLAVLVLYLRLVLGLSKRARMFAPLAPRHRRTRIVQGAVGVAIIAALAWGAMQPYLFVTSIFPGSYLWAGYALLGLALALLLFAAFPRRPLTEREP
ncbi:MAG: serine hydrolase [Spirochaetes bacterium]|nr:serine hydrolase [Spirochaetota bacterium]